jgi:hypothetical protein
MNWSCPGFCPSFASTGVAGGIIREPVDFRLFSREPWASALAQGSRLNVDRETARVYFAHKRRLARNEQDKTGMLTQESGRTSNG